ncbi:MAG: SAM-dependent methyltransferase [Paludibacteraceae bacterium]|nr:SAM-dependent methyltransferase [Paludibacteraceae bacterium]
MANERQTDLLVASLLNSAGIDATPNGSKILEVQNALKTASKRGTGHKGFPEYVAQVGDFIMVIEDKADRVKQAKYLDANNQNLLMDDTSISNYAENGALHYAQKIVANTHFNKVFAFGCSGTESENLIIRPIFVSPTSYKLLDKIKDFSNFSVDKISSYYTTVVCQEKTADQIELENILAKASSLHEDLHIYGSLSNEQKPIAVSAILLAIENPHFSTEDLTGDQNHTDGQKVYDALESYMEQVEVAPQEKKERVLDEFRFIKTSPKLSQYEERLGKTPIRFFAEYLYSNVSTAFHFNTPEDILGRFYGEFMSYSGGDGQSLGIILTPKHITQLFCDLVNLKPSDVVFDPTCGTGGFLVAAMHNMLNKARTNQQRKDIRRQQLYGIEQNVRMYSIATTNMILRGDGKSNLVCADFLKQDTNDLRQRHFTVGLMNPPYSLAINGETRHLSELHFIKHLLDSLDDGARCAVIVPQSTMVGKTTKDKEIKYYLLEHHTLEGVVTLNPDTFYRVGTNPVIAIFTAHQPQPSNYYSKFINFKDDGYETKPHIGFVPTNRAKERREFLLECWNKNRPAPNDFMVRSTVTAEDEWLHSFYYFNEDIPTDADFEKTMADYLTFEFNMIAHGRGYLFENTNEEKEVTL